MLMRLRSAFLLLTLATIFALLTVGAYVTAAGYGDACGSSVPSDYPLCQGHLLPPLQAAPIAEYSHRLLASLSTLFLFVTTFLFWRDKGAPGGARRSLYAASMLIVAEVFLGAAVVAATEPTWLVTLHQADALLVFGFVVAAFALGIDRRPNAIPPGGGA
jgi:heme A synthase